jgi:hypothetical protein
LIFKGFNTERKQLMKRISIIITLAVVTSYASAESVLKPLNEKGYGTISGRVQSLSMSRDYEAAGNGANSTIGIVLGYISPEFAGVDLGVTYNGAGEIYDNNTSGMLANDPVNLINEAWLRYNLGILNLTNTAFSAGRKVNNGEIFRKDDYRQKSRAVEAVQFTTKDIKDANVTVGHAIKMSSWIQAGDRWEFNDFNDVFSEAGAAISNDTDGITWAEAVCTGVENLEVAVFDAYAWDIVNMFGGRATLDVAEKSSILGYYRHESDVGDVADRTSDMYGLSVQQKVGGVKLEAGYFGVHGATLRFNELTTGINHALGASMMVYSGQFNGGADTAYLKAVTKIRNTQLYGLYNYTWHDEDKTSFDGQELNLVVKQYITDNFSVALKGGLGNRQTTDKENGEDTTAVDARLFITYLL